MTDRKAPGVAFWATAWPAYCQP